MEIINARTVLDEVYGVVAFRMRQRRAELGPLKNFSLSLANRKVLATAPVTPGNEGGKPHLYQPLKAQRKVTVMVGMNSECKSTHQLRLKSHPTTGEVYTAIKKQAWCPEGKFKLVCGEKTLEEYTIKCDDAIFGSGQGVLRLVRLTT